MYIVYISADKIINLQNFHTNFGICFDTEDRLFQKERKNIHKNLSLTRQICQIHHLFPHMSKSLSRKLYVIISQYTIVGQNIEPKILSFHFMNNYFWSLSI